jgi:hypothetical protein
MDTTITGTIMIAIAHSAPTHPPHSTLVIYETHIYIYIQRSNNISTKNNTFIFYFLTIKFQKVDFVLSDLYYVPFFLFFNTLAKYVSYL